MTVVLSFDGAQFYGSVPSDFVSSIEGQVSDMLAGRA